MKTRFCPRAFDSNARSLSLAVSALALATGSFSNGCAVSAQELVTLELAAESTGVEGLVTRDGVELALSDARLAFGPLTLCPGVQAGSLCDTARLEWRKSEVIDLVETSRQDLGELVGATGSVRSYMYDLGFASVLTADEPLVLPAAAELGERSLVASGVALLPDATLVPFTLAVVVKVADEGEQGQPIVRKSQSETFEHEVVGSDEGLVVRFAPDEIFAGLTASDFSRTCEAEADCEAPLELAADSSAAKKVASELTSGARPTFRWR